MTEIAQFLMNHGYPTLFVAVFARQIGLPIPAPGFLLAAGALAAAGRLNMVPSITLAVIGCVAADWAWYEAGRGWGERVLHFIHRFAPDPGGLTAGRGSCLAALGVNCWYWTNSCPALTRLCLLWPGPPASVVFVS